MCVARFCNPPLRRKCQSSGRPIKSAVDQLGDPQVAVYLPYNLLHDCMMGRQSARGVSGQGITRELEGLATTATEVDGLTRAALAWLRHPIDTAEAIEHGRSVPDPRQWVLSYVLTRKHGELPGSRAGKHISVRCHGELLSPPPPHAGLGEGTVVVGNDIDDLHPARESRARRPNNRLSLLQLTPGW